MTYPEISSTARRGAFIIAVVATVTLLSRFYLRWEQSESALAALSYMAQYFTLLTNTITLILMVWIAMGRNLAPRLIHAVIIAIVCVGLFYHALLAHLVNLSGFELWADQWHPHLCAYSVRVVVGVLRIETSHPYKRYPTLDSMASDL